MKKISEVQIFPVRPDNGLVGFASFVYDNSIYCGSVGIYTRPQGGYRLTFPTRGKYNLFHPINQKTTERIEQAVMLKFEEVMKEYGRHDSTDTQ